MRVGVSSKAGSVICPTLSKLHLTQWVGKNVISLCPTLAISGTHLRLETIHGNQPAILLANYRPIIVSSEASSITGQIHL